MRLEINKIKIISLIILVLILTSTGLINVNGVVVENVDGTNVGDIQQESVFYIPSLDIWYVFYIEDSTKLYYEISRTGGEYWGWKTRIDAPIGSQFSHSWSYSVTLNLNKTMFFILQENSGTNERLSIQKFGMSQYDQPMIGVFVGMLHGHGWDTAIPPVVGVAYYDFAVIVDSLNVPWITYHRSGGATGTPYVTKSTNPSGDWITDAGFPYQLLLNAGTRWYVQGMRLVDEGMLFTYYETVGGAGGMIRYNYYNGTGFEGSLTVENTDPYKIHATTYFNYDTTYKGTTGKIVWRTYSDYDLYYREFDQITKTWSDREFVALGESETLPKITTHTNNDLDVVMYGLNNETLNYVIRDNGVWSEKVEWITDTDIGLQPNEEISITKSGAYTVKNQLAYVYSTEIASYNVNFIPIPLSYPPTAPIYIENSTEIYDQWGNMINSNGTDVWLFEGEVYNITATFNNTEYGYLNFTDGEHNIRFEYDNRTGAEVLRIVTDRELVVGLVAGNKVTINTTYDIYGNYTLGSATKWNATDYIFNIYNLGGLVEYTFVGDSGKITGGHALEIYNENSSGGAYAESSSMYRRLQHAHLLFSLDVEDNDCFDIHEQTADVYVGIQYRDENGDWIDGWYARITIVNGAVDSTGVGADKAWIIPQVRWYSRDSGGTVSTVRNQLLSGYPECGNDVTSDISHTRFYVDLWFDKMNSSTTIGGRVATYYYGIEEGGWMLWSSWNPVKFNTSESMFFDDLRDVSGNVITSYDIELMRFWIRVDKVGSGNGEDCDNHRWRIKYPQVSYTKAEDRMESINTPDGVETLEITMPSSGWLQPLAKAIEGISTAIWRGALSFIKIFIGGIDSFLMFLNAPLSMTQMINFMMVQATVMLTWISFVLRRVTDILNVFTGLINAFVQYIGVTLSAVLWVITNVVGFPLQVIMFLVSIVNGTPYTIGGHTFDFTMGHEIIEGGLQLAPYGFGFAFCFWLFFGDVWGEKQDLEGLPNRIVLTFEFIKRGYLSIFWIYNHAKNEIIRLYNFIIAHIPAIGGGGGVSEE